MTPHTVRSALRATLLASVVLAACSKSDRNAADTGAAARRDSAAATRGDTGRRDTLARADTGANASHGGWTDKGIVAFVEAANTGEIEAGQLAERKATNPAAKAYARQMVTDHRAMMNEGKSLAGKLKLTADTAAGAAHDLRNHVRDEMKDLNDKKAGADWDKDYIDKAVDDHKNVLDKLQDAAKNTTNTELRAALEKATAKVQEHLTKAQDIQATKLKG
jgi:putative membrane protein